MRRARLVGVCCLLVVFVGLALGGLAGGSVAEETGTETLSTADSSERSPVTLSPAFLQTGEVDADRVVLRATVDDAGDAAWQIEYRIRLADDDDRDGFDALADDIAANESAYTDEFADRLSATAETASEATGREMAIADVRIETETTQLPQEYGIVRYEFAWTGFGAVEGDSLLLGDALDRLFLDEDTRLVLAWPDGYALDSATPTPDSTGETSVEWNGPTDFVAGEPRVVVAQVGLPIATIALASGIVLLSLGAVFWLRRDDPWLAGLLAKTPAEATDAADHADSADTSSAGAAAGTAGSVEQSASTEPDSGTAGSPVDDELLSNEERVLRLLEANGGRMKQQQVVSELGWTEARTSQVVSGLREEGALESFRLGRENVLRLPEDDEAN